MTTKDQRVIGVGAIAKLDKVRPLLEMRKSGMTFAQISRETGLHQVSIGYWLNPVRLDSLEWQADAIRDMVMRVDTDDGRKIRERVQDVADAYGLSTTRVRHLVRHYKKANQVVTPAVANYDQVVDVLEMLAANATAMLVSAVTGVPEIKITSIKQQWRLPTSDEVANYGSEVNDDDEIRDGQGNEGGGSEQAVQ